MERRHHTDRAPRRELAIVFWRGRSGTVSLIPSVAIGILMTVMDSVEQLTMSERLILAERVMAEIDDARGMEMWVHVITAIYLGIATSNDDDGVVVIQC